MSGRRLALDEAAAGMVLAEALLDGHGAVLLPGGATLSEATLNSLRRRGVEHCCVVDAAAAPARDPAVLARERQQQLERLRHLFRHHAGADGGGGGGGDTGGGGGGDTGGGGDGGGAELLRLLTDYRLRERP